jgi:hypothetical protein
MSRAIFAEMFSDMSHVFTDLWGQECAFELADGRNIVCQAIFSAQDVEQSIGGHGVAQSMSYPRLDIRRADLLSNLITDLEDEMDGAIVTIDGRTYCITEPRDDHRVMLRCRLALSPS